MLWYRYRQKGESYPLVLARGCVRSDPSELTVVLVALADMSEHKREYSIKSGDVSFAHIVSSPTKTANAASTPVNPEESG
jgi:hypothetical protein